jgi:hypothetical protein
MLTVVTVADHSIQRMVGLTREMARVPFDVLFSPNQQLQESALQSQPARNPQLLEWVKAPNFSLPPITKQICGMVKS